MKPSTRAAIAASSAIALTSSIFTLAQSSEPEVDVDEAVLVQLPEIGNEPVGPTRDLVWTDGLHYRWGIDCVGNTNYPAEYSALVRSQPGERGYKISFDEVIGVTPGNETNPDPVVLPGLSIESLGKGRYTYYLGIGSAETPEDAVVFSLDEIAQATKEGVELYTTLGNLEITFGLNQSDEDFPLRVTARCVANQPALPETQTA
jgi:hypothetical protein